MAVSGRSCGRSQPRLEPSSCQTVSGDRRPWTWVYSEQANYEGLVRNELASFWTPRLSHAFAQAPAEQRMPPSRRGSRPPRDELALKAKTMHRAGLSYGQTAINLRVSKATAWWLVTISFPHTIGLLHAIKGVGARPFYRWLHANHLEYVPLPA